MTATNLNIRTDKAVKEEADRIFSELGLNMTTAINMFLRTTIREHGIPFALKLNEPNDVTQPLSRKADASQPTAASKAIPAWMN